MNIYFVNQIFLSKQVSVIRENDLFSRWEEWSRGRGNAADTVHTTDLIVS